MFDNKDFAHSFVLDFSSGSGNFLEWSYVGVLLSKRAWSVVGVILGRTNAFVGSRFFKDSRLQYFAIKVCLDKIFVNFQ